MALPRTGSGLSLERAVAPAARSTVDARPTSGRLVSLLAAAGRGHRRRQGCLLNREIREKRFRFGDREREELAGDEQRLREAGEANRFLPVLFCSPTCLECRPFLHAGQQLVEACGAA